MLHLSKTLIWMSLLPMVRFYLNMNRLRTKQKAKATRRQKCRATRCRQSVNLPNSRVNSQLDETDLTFWIGKSRLEALKLQEAIQLKMVFSQQLLALRIPPSRWLHKSHSLRSEANQSLCLVILEIILWLTGRKKKPFRLTQWKKHKHQTLLMLDLTQRIHLRDPRSMNLLPSPTRSSKCIER